MRKRQTLIFCFVIFVMLFSLLIAQDDNPLIWIGNTDVISTDNVNEIITLISPDDAIKQISFSPDNMMLEQVMILPFCRGEWTFFRL